MKKLFAVVLVAAIAIYLPSCKKKNNDPPANTAGVMFVNACTTGTNTTLDAKLTNTSIGGATNIQFLKNTSYQYIKSGSGTISFHINGVGNVLTSGSVNLTTNQKYTAFAGGVINAPVFLLASDDFVAPTSGAKVRFVNLSPENLNTNCFIGTPKVDSGRSYPSAGAFVSIPAGSANILMQDPTRPTLISQINNYNFINGKVYTVMLTGASTGTGSTALTLTVITNN